MTKISRRLHRLVRRILAAGQTERINHMTKGKSMATYKISNKYKTAEVVRQLRGEGFCAWAETSNGVDVLCTDAGLGIIGICAGNGLWAEHLYAGLPS